MAQVAEDGSKCGQSYGDTEPKIREHVSPWSSLFIFTTKSHTTVLCTAVFLNVAAGAIKPTIAIFLGYLFDELVNSRTENVPGAQVVKDVAKWCLLLAGLGFSAWIINGGYFALWMIFGDMQAKSAREKLFIGLLENDMNWYDLRSDGIRSLLTRIQTQIKELQVATSPPLGFFIEDITAALAALGIAFHGSWRLTLLIFSCAIPALGIVWLTSRKYESAIEAQKQELALASKLAITSIAAVETVKVFNGQNQEANLYKDTIEGAGNSYLSQAHISSLRLGVSRFMSMAMFCASFWYGASQVNQGLSIGSILTTFYACFLAAQSMQSYQAQLLLLSKGRSAGATLKRLIIEMTNSHRVRTLEGSLRPENCKGEVRVSNLSFSYPSNPTQLVLDNTTFFFPAGQTTFVIGRSGSGKSTLSKILMKFYEPTAGHLLIDGYPIQALDPDWVRVSVSLVQQQSVLFNETVFRNIAFGQPNYASVTKELVQLACQTALLQHTIDDLPKGLDTIIGADSNLMSGGQVQRIAIARARIRDAPILVLDEATSAMDYITKSLVMEAIRKWRKGKTTIIITHDCSQIADDDYLYVLERGRIVQEGYRYALEMDGEVSFETSLRSTPLESFFPDSGKLLYEKAPTGDKSKPPDAVPSQVYGPVIELDKEFKIYPKGVPRIFSVNQEVLESSEALDREASCGLPTSSARAIAPRAANVSPVSKVDFQHIPQIPLSKPLPPLLHETMSIVDGAALHWSEIPTKFELLDMGHYNNYQNRRERIKLERFKNNTEISWNSLKGGLLKFWFSRSKNREHGGSLEQKRMNSSVADILKTVWPSLPWKGRITLVLGFISAFISAIATPAFSYALSRLLSTLSMTSNQAKETLKWGSSIIGLAVADGLSTYLWRYCFEDAGQRWVDNLRVRALKRIIAQPKAWFERDKNASSHITECLDRDVEEMRNLVGRFVGTIFMVVLMISIATIASFVVCWKITLASIATYPFMYIFTRIFGTVSSIWEMRLNKASDAITKVLSETFSDISTVRALTLEGYFKQKHAEAIQRTYNVGRKRAIYDGILFGVSNSTINFFIAIILYYSAVVIVSGEWSVQDAVLAITLLIFSAGNANAAISSIPQISSSRVTATRVLELANMPRIASHEASGKRYLRTPLPICLNSLSFTYPSRPEIEVLHQVSMTFTAGSSTAIVGSSGSGKSTIAALLFGLYPPNEPLNHHTPSLTFAGCSVFDCNIQSLREKMAVVSQTPVMFPNTIAYNITYGLPEDSILRSPQNIQTAAEEAGIHEFIISLPNGYSTNIWEGGQGLSGGQVQRIAIARALIRRPAVLVLDEPTSALDAESAGVIRDTMVRLSSSADLHGPGGHLRRKNMAAIIITHSVEMMRVVGNIIMLDSGHVVEQGGFDELARKGGAFTRLITGNN